MIPIDKPACLIEAHRVDFAYQPIVSTSSLRVHGFEALARTAPGPCGNVVDLLNSAHVAGGLREVEQVLLRSAIGKFAQYDQGGSARLFCNLDNRAYDGAVPTKAGLAALTGTSGFPLSRLCVEVSERQSVDNADNLLAMAGLLAEQGAKMAIDDFGIGNSGLHMLLTLEPDYVKIDQFFILGIATNARQQAIVAKLCGLAHSLGFLTVAEGVENEADLRMARDLGCDLAQGYHIARPTVDMAQLRTSYDQVLRGNGTSHMNAAVARMLTPMEPLRMDGPMTDAIDIFRKSPDQPLIPVIAADGTVQGALLEGDVRQLVMSDFGRALVANKGMDSRVARLVRRVPLADARGTVDAIVNAYVTADNTHGLILVEDGRFAGYLSNNAVLRLAADRAINQAREQNPLTGLPGNESIERHIETRVSSSQCSSIAFLDFDNFKPFNDAYGFAMGDRALLMFADMLQRLQSHHQAFIGHVGGDDFVLSLSMPPREAEQVVGKLRERFRRDVESLYTSQDRAAGGITAADRFGVTRFYPLLSLSAGMVHLQAEQEFRFSREACVRRLSEAKAAAKHAAGGIAFMMLEE